MDDNEAAAEKSETNSKRGFGDLSPELMARVVKNLATPNLNETAHNFNAFRRINHSTNTFIKETPTAARFVGRVKRLGERSTDVFEAAIPKDSLYEEGVGQPGSTHYHVAVAVSVLGSRTRKDKAELVAKVSDLSDRFGVRSEASIPLIASEHIDPEDRNDLIENVRRSYNRNRTDYSWAATNEELGAPALYALKEAHERNYLTDEQKAKLPPGALDRQKPHIPGIGDRPTFPKGQEFKNRLWRELTAAPEGVQIDRKIDKLENELAVLSNDLPDLADHSDASDIIRSVEFEKLEVIGEHLAESYSKALDLYLKDDPQRPSGEARAELMNSQRRRGSQDCGL